jgi:hypothetical protein
MELCLGCLLLNLPVLERVLCSYWLAVECQNGILFRLFTTEFACFGTSSLFLLVSSGMPNSVLVGK